MRRERVAPDDVTRRSPHEGTCDVAFEVSGADDGLDRAAVLVRPGARIVLVGIPDDDSTTVSASIMRRKGLTLAFARRMTENAYMRAIALAAAARVDLSWLATRPVPARRRPGGVRDRLPP